MKKAFKIAKWEFLEKVKQRSFIISMILTPIILISMGIIPSLLATSDQETTKPIGILDFTGKYFDQLSEKLESYTLTNNQPNFIVLRLKLPTDSIDNLKNEADKKVIDNAVEGYIFIEEDTLGLPYVEYRSSSVGNFKDLKKIENSFNEVLAYQKLSSAGLDYELIAELTKSVDITTITITEEGKEEKSDFLKTFFTSYAFIMLLMMLILFSGGMLVRSLVEEKSNRIIEILLSSCKTNDLLMGKMLGLSFLGLFQISIWTIVGMGLIGTSLITLDLFHNIGLQLVYFVLGYMLYTSIFVGIGSIVSTEQEAQQITGYISILLIIPIVLAIQVIQNPDSIIAIILSYFPLTTSPLMLLRLNIYTPPLWEIILTIFISIVSIYLVIFLSTKIFRIGILSYGKRPTLKELKNWISQKEH